MAEFSRKKLKQDRFAEVVGQEVELFQRHKSTISIAVIAILAAIVGGYSYKSYLDRVAAEASSELLAAVRLFHGVVTTEPRPGRVNFATSGERQRRVSEAFENVIRDYPNREEGAGAQYYLGLLAVQHQEYDEAQKRFETAIAGDGTYSALARLALANTLASEGKTDEARKHFEYVIDHPTPVAPKERAQLALARMLVETDPEAARPILEELMAQPGAVSVAAGVTMRRIQGT